MYRVTLLALFVLVAVGCQPGEQVFVDGASEVRFAGRIFRGLGPFEIPDTSLEAIGQADATNLPGSDGTVFGIACIPRERAVASVAGDRTVHVFLEWELFRSLRWSGVEGSSPLPSVLPGICPYWPAPTPRGCGAGG